LLWQKKLIHQSSIREFFLILLKLIVSFPPQYLELVLPPFLLPHLLLLKIEVNKPSLLRLINDLLYLIRIYMLIKRNQLIYTSLHETYFIFLAITGNN